MIDTPSFKGGVYPRRAICRRGFLSVVVLCGPRVTLSVVGSGSRVTLFVVVLCGSRVTLGVLAFFWANSNPRSARFVNVNSNDLKNVADCGLISSDREFPF